MGGCCGKQAAIIKGKELVDGGGSSSTAGGDADLPVSSILHTGPTLTAEQIDQRKQITTIYKHYKPKQMDELAGIFDKYNGREKEVLEDLWRQYPATVRASAKVGYDFYGGDKNEEAELRESSVASSAMGAFRASQATDCWVYLDNDHELGPFTVTEMQERLKDGRFKEEGMKLKMSHWQDWHSLSEVFASGEAFSTVVPIEPGVAYAPSSASSSLVSMKGAAPRPMMHRKGSLIPIVQGALLPATSSSSSSPAPAPASAPALAPALAPAPATAPGPDPATPTALSPTPKPTPNPIALPV
jgi:hypothetical protein